MSCGYFSERKNCTEHDYAIFRTIERFPGSEMTKTAVARKKHAIFTVFANFEREKSNFIAAYIHHLVRHTLKYYIPNFYGEAPI